MMPGNDIATPEPPAEWSFADLVAVLRRRQTWIFGSLSLCFLLACLDWCCTTPRYRATAEIEVRKDAQGAFGLENATADRPSSSISDSFDENLTLQTETGILESDAVALAVIERTGLETTPDYFARHTGRFSFLHRLLSWQTPIEPLSIPLPQAPNRRYAAFRIFARHRSIQPIAGTRLIAIRYSDPDPRRAAAVVDALIQELAHSDFQSRSSAAAQSAEWLSAQLAALKQQTDALDARAAALDRASGAYGDDDAHNVVLARLDSLNTAVSAAQSNRILRAAIWRAVSSGNPEVISSLGGNAAAGVATQNSFALLQSLRSQESQAQAQLAAATDRYGENWPGLREQRAHLATTQKAIQDEVARLGQRAHSDYDVAVQTENAARDAYRQQEQLASGMTGNTLALRLARQEAEQSRTLYTSLEGRLEQAGVLEGLHSQNFAVVSPALIPAPDHPASPNALLLAALALAAGLVTGCSAAVLRELTDSTVHSAADLEALLDAPVFATLPEPIPAVPWYQRLFPVSSQTLLALEASAGAPELPLAHSAFADSLQTLRASLLLAHSSHAPQVITIAPSNSGRDAESTRHFRSSALGLAAVLAQHGAPTLFLDADLRSAPAPGNGADPGLSEMLASNGEPEQPETMTGLPLLSMIPAGTRPPCSSELIASARMNGLLAAWRERYRFIVINGPTAACADGLVLAQSSDAVLLSARAGVTHRQPLLSAWNAISRQISDHAVLGLILEGAHGDA
jgi:succinoglycan biosynthesis transport protein ExoP